MSWKVEVSEAFCRAVKNYKAKNEDLLRLTVIDISSILEEVVTNYLQDENIPVAEKSPIIPIIQRNTTILKLDRNTISSLINCIHMRNDTVHQRVIPDQYLVRGFIEVTAQFIERLGVGVSEARALLEQELEENDVIEEDLNEIVRQPEEVRWSEEEAYVQVESERYLLPLLIELTKVLRGQYNRNPNDDELKTYLDMIKKDMYLPKGLEKIKGYGDIKPFSHEIQQSFHQLRKTMINCIRIEKINALDKILRAQKWRRISLLQNAVSDGLLSSREYQKFGALLGESDKFEVEVEKLKKFERDQVPRISRDHE